MKLHTSVDIVQKYATKRGLLYGKSIYEREQEHISDYPGRPEADPGGCQ